MRVRTHRPRVLLASVGRSWRSVPVLVWAATGAFAGLMLAMTILYPVNYGIDEAGHFDMAYSYSLGHGPYQPGTRFIAQGILAEEQYNYLGNPPSPSFGDTAPPQRSDRLSIDRYGGDVPSIVPDQMTQHPPLYYLLGAAVLATPGVSGLPYDVQFALLRLLSLLCLLPLPWLFFKTAQRLGAGSLAPVAALTPLMVPGMARVGGSVTNDSLLILAFSAVLYLVTRVITGDATRRTAVWMAVWLGVALLTKGFALQLPLVALLAYGVCWLRFRHRVGLPALIVAVGSALGGLWWLHNLIAYGHIQPSGYPPHYNDSAYLSISQGHGTPANFVPKFIRLLTTRFWSSLGLLEPPFGNSTFAAAATLLILLLVSVGIAYGLRGRWGRLAPAMLVLPVLFTLVILVQGSWSTWHAYKVAAGIQGRYIYPPAIGFMSLAVYGLSRLLRGPAVRWVAPAVFAAAAYIQWWSVHVLVREWWYPRNDGIQGSAYHATFAAFLSWSPWPVGVTVAIGVAIAVLFGWLTWAAFWPALTGGRRRPTTAAPVPVTVAAT